LTLADAAGTNLAACCCAVCPHSLQHGDPLCKNGGRLHADNYTQSEPERYNNCVQCDCPAGWAGIDCSCELSDRG
jgi:hypothetical protein